MSSGLKIFVGIIFLAFFVFGLFMLDIPSVNPDELWIASDANYLKEHHHPGSSLLPKEVAPIFSAVQHIGWKGWFFGTARTGSVVLFSMITATGYHAVRLSAFFWSILVCVFTFFLSRKSGLKKPQAFLCVAVLIVIPEFFQQIHLERPEIMICAAYMMGLIIYRKTTEETISSRKKKWLLLCGIYSWLPALFIHPSAIIIPVTIGILYLIQERKNIFSLNTIMIGIGLAGGFLFFYFVVHSMSEYAQQSGGGDFFAHRGPPVFVYGWKQFFRMPLLFYNNFNSYNFITKPLSFLLFGAAIVLLFMARKKINVPSVSESVVFLCVATITPIIFLLLFSGSYGQYNIIIAPLVAFIITCMIVKMSQNNSSSAMSISFLLLLICCSVNVFGMKNSYDQTREFQKINQQLKEVIPENESVIGSSLYYEPFKHQPYYSISWFNPASGNPKQSFEDATHVLNVKYLIVDDAFVARAFLDRGESWTDSMLTDIIFHWLALKKIETNYYVGNRVPDPMLFPSSWYYPELKKNYISRIYVYKKSE